MYRDLSVEWVALYASTVTVFADETGSLLLVITGTFRVFKQGHFKFRTFYFASTLTELRSFRFKMKGISAQGDVPNIIKIPSITNRS